jgi:DNA-binding CsgD family transcriptional regulator
MRSSWPCVIWRFVGVRNERADESAIRPALSSSGLLGLLIRQMTECVLRQVDLLDRGWQLVLIGLLLAIMIGGIVDLILDAPTTLLSFHTAFEVAFILLCLGTAIFLWMAGSQAERSLRRTREALASHESELERWRVRARRLLRGLGEEIDEQMRSWGLSPAEREIALFLLKGYSTKEIAAQLGKSERTVRQQCSAVYKRSGLGGRAELSAFFLEDLLLPQPEDSAEGETRRTSDPTPAEL